MHDQIIHLLSQMKIMRLALLFHEKLLVLFGEHGFSFIAYYTVIQKLQRVSGNLSPSSGNELSNCKCLHALGCHFSLKSAFPLRFKC